MHACEEYLSEYLGFEGIGLLFKDTRTGLLFNIQQNYNEEEERVWELVKAKKAKKERLTTAE